MIPLCCCSLSLNDCWYLMSSFSVMLLFLIPLIHIREERAWGFENILALVKLLHMILEFISGSCLQQLWPLLLPEKDFSVVSFPPVFMNESFNRKNCCSFYMVSINLCQYRGYLVYLGGIIQRGWFCSDSHSFAF